MSDSPAEAAQNGPGAIPQAPPTVAPPPARPPLDKARFVRYLFAAPHRVPVIRSAMEWHYRTQGKPFRWSDVRAAPKELDYLVLDLILSKTGPGLYTVTDYDTAVTAMIEYMEEVQRARARAAPLQNAATLPRAPALPLPPGAPRDLFSDVVGFDSIKNEMLLALGARKPVHVLLWGPPASSKTVFLLGVKSLPGALYYLGHDITAPGMRKLLLDEKPPYLVIDEIDKLDPKAQSMLLGIMEGRVTILQHGDNRNEDVGVRIFSAANVIGKLKPELRSRFHKIQVPEFTPEEFREVAYRHLTRTGTEHLIADFVARGVSTKSKDLRDAVRIANMARDLEWAKYLVELLGQEARL